MKPSVLRLCLLLCLVALHATTVAAQSLMPIPTRTTSVQTEVEAILLTAPAPTDLFRKIDSLSLQLAKAMKDSAGVRLYKRRLERVVNTTEKATNETITGETITDEAIELARTTCWRCLSSRQRGGTTQRQKIIDFLDKPDVSTLPAGSMTRRMWYEEGGKLLLAAKAVREAARDTYRAELVKLTQPTKPDQIAPYRENISKLTAALDAQNEMANSLEGKAHYFSYFGSNLNRINFFPVRNRQHAPLYFNSTSTAKAGEFLGRSISAINPSNGKYSQYTEVFADFIGWTRVAVGATVVSSKNDPAATPEENRQDEAVQRLTTGGGNLLLLAALPVVSFHTRDNHFAIKGHLQPRFATDLPQQGQPADNFAYHSEMAVEFYGYYNGYNSVISPYMCVRVGQNWGNSNFYNNLQRNSHAGFTLVQIDAGLSLGKAVQVGIKYNTGQTFIQKAFPMSIAVSLVPTEVLK